MKRKTRRLVEYTIWGAAVALAITLPFVAFGSANENRPPDLRLVSETPKTITLGWTPAPNVVGYEFAVDGKRVSWTLEGPRSKVTFWKRGQRLSVQPLGMLPAGNWVPAATTGPSTQSLGGLGDGSALDLRVVRETPKTYTLAWTPPENVVGYLFEVDDARISSTFDADRAEATFWKRPGRVDVVPIGPLDAGVWEMGGAEGAGGPVTPSEPSGGSSAPVAGGPATPPPTAPVAQAASGASAGWDGVVASLPQLSFSAARTVGVADATALRNALAGLRAGDMVRATAPFSVTGATLLIRAQLASLAVIDLHGVTIRTGTAGSLEHAVAIVGAQNVWVTGGDVSTQGNVCLWFQDTVSVTWRDVDVHDCAGTGVMAQGITRAQTGLDIHARVWNAGTAYTRLDPHADQGTGVHGAYIGGASYPTSGRFAFDVRDQAVGAAVQAGANLVDSDIWVRAARITRVASSQVAGNALQLWGAVRNVRVRWLAAQDLAGRGIETDGLTGGSGIVVDYARTDRARLSPEYGVSAAVTYRDVG